MENSIKLRNMAGIEVSALKMPYSAKYMMEHYLSIGRENDKVYVGVADGAGVVFTELSEY